MDGSHFDDVVRSLKESRRSLLGGAIAAATGGIGVRIAEARKRGKQRKKRKPRARPNQYGCLEIDDPCKTAEQCCSGICEGKKGKKRCRAHGAGTCKPQPGVCTDPDPGYGTCNNDNFCYCHRTTANSIYCANQAHTDCADCRKDADCVALGYPVGSACIPYSEGICSGACESGMACAIPCGYEPVE
jgi:hypothetical protein